jgi:ribonuclease P protein component
VLARARRLRRSAEFDLVVRQGRRAGTPRLVVHALASDTEVPATVGFVVGRTVGIAVTRNRVRRRLQHLVAARLDTLPAGSSFVVRALPAAAQVDSDRLGADLDNALPRVTAAWADRKRRAGS